MSSAGTTSEDAFGRPLDDQASTFGAVLRQAWPLLEPRTRHRLVVATVLSLAVSALDIVGVATLPILLQQVDTTESPTINLLPSALVDLSTTTLALVVVACFTLKSVLAAALVDWQIGFVESHLADRSTLLFRHYLEVPYSEQHDRHSSEFASDVLYALDEVYGKVAGGWILISTDGITIATIGLFVAIANPSAAGVLGAYLALIALAYLRLVRGRATRFGQEELIRTRTVLRHVQESYASMKTVAVYRIQGTLTDGFRTQRSMLGRARHRVRVLNLLPRYVLESAVVVGVGLSAAVAFATGSRTEAIATIGLIGAAAFRVFPSLNRALSAVTLIQSASYAISRIRPALLSLDSTTDPASVLPHAAPPPPTVLDAREVTFSYEPGRPLLQGIDLAIHEGEFVAIVGPSGAGKTTLIDLVLGLLEPVSGRIRRLASEEIGYIPQEVHLWDGTIEFNVSLDRSPPDGESRSGAVERALAEAQLSEWIDQMPNGASTRVGESGGRLSGGQRHRIGIARGLYHRPRLIVMDEPTAALDEATADSLIEAVLNLGSHVAVVAVTHSPRLAARADKVVEMRDGRASVQQTKGTA